MGKHDDELGFLREEIATGIDGLGRHIKANPPFIMLISLIRELDVQLTIPYKDGTDNPPLSTLYKFGWPLLFKESYRLFDMKPQPMLFISDKEQINYTRQILSFSGRVGVCQLFMDYLHYGIIGVARVVKRDVEFEWKHKYFGIERFDMEYRAMVSEYIIESIKDKAQLIAFEAVQPLIRQTAKSPIPQLMSYTATEEYMGLFQAAGQQSPLTVAGA